MEQPSKSKLDQLHDSLMDALIAGLQNSEDADKYVRHALEFLKYRGYTPDTPSGEKGAGKKELDKLVGEISRVTSE